MGAAGISAISFAELMFGVRNRRPEQRRAAVALFEQITVLPFDHFAALRYAELPFRRHSYDRLIAAHALALDATLVTNNTADFADITGLGMENWLA